MNETSINSKLSSDGVLQNVVVAHSGTHHSYMTALAMQEAGRLAKYFTSFYYKKSSAILRAASLIPALQRSMARRRNSELDESRIRIVPQYEFLQKLIDRSIRRGQTDNRLVYWRDRRFDASVARSLRVQPAGVFIGYPNCALDSFTATRSAGGRCLLDLPIGHSREAQRIFAEERELHPEFADTITYSDFDQQYADRTDREFEIADNVLVPSRFVHDTLVRQGIAAEKIVQLPYGSWVSPPEHYQPPSRVTAAPLRVIYFGQITQRKGIKYLFEAVDSLQASGIPVKLTLVGELFGKLAWLPKYRDIFEHFPHMPRQRLKSIVSEHDVFVLPTLFEGSAYVIPESLSLGVPVITTSNAGAESITDGHNGYLVPIRDPQAIAEKLVQLQADADLLNSMKINAVESSREVTWSRYRTLLADWLQSQPAS